MDAYDIFKKLTKGLTFKTRLLGKKPEVNLQDKSKIITEKLEIKHENDNSDDEIENLEDLNKNGFDLKSDQDKTKKKRRKKITEEKLTAIEKEEGRQRRIEHGIKVNGSDPPNPLKDFYSLVDKHEVDQKLVENLIQCGYMEPTPIQRQAIPCMLENRQILACAPTGSGKTAAFILPILQTLKSPQRGSPRALVLCPTRELAKQIYREALRLSAGTNLVINFVPKISLEKIESKKSILNKTDILISTPNRLCYLLNHDSSPLNLQRVKWLIVDEADRLFEGKEGNESDFRPQLEKIMQACNILETSMAFFSATQTPVIVDWCRRNMDQLLCITVGQRNAATELVKQELLYVGNENGKLVAFRQLVQQGLKPPVLVFVQSKDRAKQLFKELLYDGINVDVIHADRTQLQRDNVVRSFRIGKIWVLICTELMGRGIDFKGVNLVINYDFPPSSISYVHRIGRAGRAGQPGRAVTFFTQDDLPNLRSIVVVMRQSGCEVPEYMLTLKQTRKNRKQMLKFAPKRDDISTDMQSRKRKLSNPQKNNNSKKMKMSDDAKKGKKEGERSSTKKKPQFMKKALGKKSKTGKDGKSKSNNSKNKNFKSKNKKAK